MRGRALAAGVAALAVSACGSTPLSTSQLRSGATRVCLLAGRQTDRIATPASPAASDMFLERGIAVLKPELATLRTLRPPSDLADVYTTSINAFAKKLVMLKDTIRDLAGGEDPVIAIKTLQRELAPIESEENGGWRALGIPACVNR